jgi:hypothetical protein
VVHKIDVPNRIRGVHGQRVMRSNRGVSGDRFILALASGSLNNYLSRGSLEGASIFLNLILIFVSAFVANQLRVVVFFFASRVEVFV